MGIHNILPFLRKKVPGAFCKDFREIRSFMMGKNVAIDANNHTIRLAHAHGTCDSKTVARAVCEWVQDVQVAMGVKEAFLVFDGAHNVSKADWEAKRRAKVRQQQVKALMKKEEAVIEVETKSAADVFAEEADDLGIPAEARVTYVDPGTKRKRSMTYQEAVKERAIKRVRMERDKHRERNAIRIGRREMGDIALNIRATMEDKDTHVAFAEADGETACVQLCMKGDAHVVVSNDSDCVVFPGSKHVLMYPPRSGPQLVDVVQIRETLGLTERQMVVMAILAGCDFSPHIHKMGPAGALKLAQSSSDDAEWSSILAAMPKGCGPPPDYEEEREAFLALCAVEFPKAESLFTPCIDTLALEHVPLDKRFKLTMSDPSYSTGYGSDDIDL